jgi:hypothetical protein
MSHTQLPGSEAMRNADRWILWKSIPNEDPEKKPRKVPVYSSGRNRQGELDTPRDIANLSTYDEACREFKSGKYAELGFALGYDGNGGYWQGIDFDNLSENTNLKELIPDLPGYVENSPSKNGLHAIGYGEDFHSMGSNSTGIEAYSKGRYFTVTGDKVADNPLTCLADFIESRLRPIHSPPKKKKSSKEPRTNTNELSLDELRSALFYIPAADRDVWQRMGHALKTLGDDGRDLFMSWSATSDKHDPSADAETWDSFQPNRTGYKAVFAEAINRGWFTPCPRGESASEGLPRKQEEQTLGTGRIFTSARDLLEHEIRVDYLIKPFFEKDSLGQMFGPYGCGKTFTALGAACAVATGGHFACSEANKGLVLFLAGEGHQGLKRRIKAFAIESKLSADDLSLLNVSKSAVPFDNLSRDKIITEGFMLEETFNQKIALIVIDTLARHLIGNENSTEDGNEFVQIVSTIKQAFPGSVVIIVHHSGNAEETKGRGRGASSIPAAMDFIAKINKGQMTFTKMKDGPIPEPMGFELKPVQVGVEDDGEPITSCSVNWCGVVHAEKSGLNKADQLGMDTLLATCDRLKQPCVSIHDWRDEFYRRHTADSVEAKRKAFSRSRENLTSKKLVIHDNDIYRPTGQNGTKRDNVPQCTGTGQDTPIRGVCLSGIVRPGEETPEIEWQESPDA